MFKVPRPVYFPILFMCFLFYGCKKEKGCTDKSAFNYNELAKKDDGSCKYCNKNQVVVKGMAFLIDNNSSSIHFHDSVATFTLTQRHYIYYDRDCGNDTCTYDITVINLLPEEIHFNFLFQFDGTSNMYINASDHLIIGGNQNFNFQVQPNSVSSEICGIVASEFIHLEGWSFEYH